MTGGITGVCVFVGASLDGDVDVNPGSWVGVCGCLVGVEPARHPETIRHIPINA